MLLLYILWDDWTIFMILSSNEQLQQQLEYILLKPDCHSWWISKMQTDTLEERYAIKLCFKLRKKCKINVWNASNCFWSKGLGLGLICWSFKGVLEEIPSEEASTLQIGSVPFPPGQSTSPQHTIWPRWASRHFVTLPIVEILLPVTFGYSLSSEAVIMRQLRRWKKLWQRSLTCSQEDLHGAFQILLERYNKSIAAGGDYFEGN